MGTLKKPVFIQGKGIHSGLPVNMTIKPSKKHGIFFRRIDLNSKNLIPARFDNVGDTRMRNTTIGNTKEAHVQTIEHLMAALFIAGVDRAVIDIDGKETPILDGSAAQFYDAIMKAGITSGKLKKIIVKKEIIAKASELLKELSFGARIKLFLFNLVSGRKSNGFVKLSPAKRGLQITATLIYPEKIIGKQTFSYEFDGNKKSVQNFIKEISQARTFGKISEWEYLKARGMGRGADETNVIALNDKGDGTINRVLWPDEFVRHKIIDVIGDMFTSGGFVVGKVESFKGSHALNNLVLKKLFSDKNNYDII